MVILLNSRSKFNQHNQLCSSSVMLNQTTKNYQHGHEINCESDNLDDHSCENCESNLCQQNRFLAYTMSRSTSTLSLPFPSKSSRNTSNESYRLIQTQEKNCDEQTTIGTPSTVIQFSILVSKKAGHGEQDETTSNQINTMKDDNNNIIVTTDKPIRSTWGLPLLAEKLSTKTHGDVSNFKENPADVFDRPEANNLDTVNRMQQVLSSISFNSKDSLSLSSRAQERQKVANNLTKSDIDRPFSGNKSSKELNSKTKSRTNNFSFNSTFFQPVFSILFTFSYLYLLSNLTLTPSYALRAPFRSRSAFGFNQPAGPQPNEVRFVDLLARQNAKQHATIKYELLDSNFPPLVVRRGATFKMTIGLVKSYKPQLDKIRMEFMYGARPQLGKGTLIYLPITLNIPDNKDPNKWKAKILSVNDNQLLIEVYIPPTAAVSAWRLRISTKQNGSRNIKSFDVAEAIYILFNPWSKLDTVYLEREDLKQEFVLMDIGKIYIGSYNQPKGRQWIYGQFNRDVLPAIMYMMGKTRLDYAARANPIKVVRAIAQMVNSHDDNGLLVGNWSGDYKSGTPPWSWTGSAPILEQYYETNGEPVKFGQCWVFAGVTTTVCRALGIPARTVTNFVSAHDTDDSLTVDKFFDAKGQPITDVNADSIWNFHVWTDAWMTRPDLPAGYGGWQVIDATPQETSEGLYRTGPASVEAVRRGEIGLAYDAPFVFAEVNADLVHWKLDETSPLGWKKIMTNKHHVGRKIITKKVGYISEAPDTRDAEDITDRYKNKEGSAEERMSVLNAARAGGLAYLFEIPEPGREDIRFELVKIERVPIGQPFHIIVRMYNKAPIKRTITLSVNVNTVYYTGILAHKVKTEGREIDLAPNKVVEHRVNINVADYLPYLVDYSMLKIYAVASVKETSQTWSEEDDFAVEKPPLALTVVSSGHGLTVGVPFNLAIEIANPLDIVLTGCKLTVEGTSLVNRVQTVGIPDINRKTKISHVVQLTPRRPGESNIVVTFQSRQLGDVYGSKTILIN